MNVPDGPEHDRVEVWLAPSVILAGVRLQVRPAGDTASASVTVPVNPLIGATVMVEVPESPALIVTDVGLAATEKSATAIE